MVLHRRCLNTCCRHITNTTCQYISMLRDTPCQDASIHSNKISQYKSIPNNTSSLVFSSLLFSLPRNDQFQRHSCLRHNSSLSMAPLSMGHSLRHSRVILHRSLCDQCLVHSHRGPIDLSQSFYPRTLKSIHSDTPPVTPPVTF